MKLTKEVLLEAKKYKNSLYDDIKVEFLYHSNKLEGSTFTKDAIYDIIENNMIRGNHSVDDAFETVNSVDLFDFVINDIGKPINDEMLWKYHKLLKSRTSDDINGLSGHYKTMMNRLRNTSVQVAYPQEVPDGMHKLFEKHMNKKMTIEDIAWFHARFEHIHPFQDGNGRIGRFLILKQCIENDIDVIAIDEDYNGTYKAALEMAQTSGDIKPLVMIFEHCQERLDEKLAIYKTSLEYLKKEITKQNKNRKGSLQQGHTLLSKNIKSKSMKSKKIDER